MGVGVGRMSTKIKTCTVQYSSYVLIFRMSFCPRFLFENPQKRSLLATSPVGYNFTILSSYSVPSISRAKRDTPDVKVENELACVLGSKEKTIFVRPAANQKIPNFKKNGSRDLLLLAVQ